MKKTKMAFILAGVMTLTACEPGSKQEFGTFLGMLAGAAIGSSLSNNGHHGSGDFFAIAAGTVVGAAIGGSIGRSMDRADRLAMERNRQLALESYPSGQVATWYNPDTGNSGTYLPQPAYEDANGIYCREYQQTITISGKTEEAYGKACRQPDGSWKIIN